MTSPDNGALGAKQLQFFDKDGSPILARKAPVTTLIEGAHAPARNTMPAKKKTAKRTNVVETTHRDGMTRGRIKPTAKPVKMGHETNTGAYYVCPKCAISRIYIVPDLIHVGSTFERRCRNTKCLEFFRFEAVSGAWTLGKDLMATALGKDYKASRVRHVGAAAAEASQAAEASRPQTPRTMGKHHRKPIFEAHRDTEGDLERLTILASHHHLSKFYQLYELVMQDVESAQTQRELERAK